MCNYICQHICTNNFVEHFEDRRFECDRRGLEVVADVHVHPFGEGQSNSDRNHPMISHAGHLALIIPNFAAEPVTVERLGMYRYLGGKKWLPVPSEERRSYFLVS